MEIHLGSLQDVDDYGNSVDAYATLEGIEVRYGKSVLCLDWTQIMNTARKVREEAGNVLLNLELALKDQ